MILSEFMDMPMDKALESMKLTNCKIHTNHTTGEVESVELSYEKEEEEKGNSDLNPLFRKGGVV